MYAGRGPNYRFVSTEQHRPTHERGHKAIDLAQHTVAITAYPCADGGRRHDDFRLSGNRDSVAVDPVGSGVGASATLVRGGADLRKPKGAAQQSQ